MSHIFISYSRQDKDFVERLVDDLLTFAEQAKPRRRQSLGLASSGICVNISRNWSPVPVVIVDLDNRLSAAD